MLIREGHRIFDKANNTVTHFRSNNQARRFSRHNYGAGKLVKGEIPTGDHQDLKHTAFVEKHNSA